MPKKTKNPSPAPTISATPSSAAQEAEEWRAKNARAKAIIMSTLIPGSEPWKIAEPLELASDIWKALEDRYAPKKDGEAPRTERSDFVSEWVEGKSLEKYKTGVRSAQMLTNFPADALVPEYNTALTTEEREAAIRKRGERAVQVNRLDSHWEAEQVVTEEDKKREEEKKEQHRKVAQAAAAKVLIDHMPNRDQRFLWALLHGGKEETMAWFNGTAPT